MSRRQERFARKCRGGLLEPRSGLIMGDLVTISQREDERLEAREFCLGVGLALITCPVKLGKAHQLVTDDRHYKILGVTTKMGCDRYKSTYLGPSII